MSATWYIGGALAVLRTMPASSVDLVLTSPPFLALRSYLPADHPEKATEVGSEPTPAEFLDALLDVVEECRRVLAPHGTLCLELGDTYSGSGGAGGDYHADGLREGQAKFRQTRPNEAWRLHPDGSVKTGSDVRRAEAKNGGYSLPVNGGPGWPLDRSLCMVPELLRAALAYGFNPLTGRTTPRWRVRNVVRHFRPNPPVGALGSKFRPATSDWCIAMPGERRYFDADSVRTPLTEPGAVKRRDKNYHAAHPGTGWTGDNEGGITQNPAGAPPLDWWDDDDLEWRDAAGFVAPTSGYPGAHYATFSPRVVRRLIEPQCPRRVCRVCGVPSERIVEAGKANRGARSAHAGQPIGVPHITSAEYVTLGWTDCGHGSFVCSACNVLVPYDYAIRRSGDGQACQASISTEDVLGEPLKGESESPKGARRMRGMQGGLPWPSGSAVLHEELFSQTGAQGGTGEHVRPKGGGEPGVEGRPSSGKTVGGEVLGGVFPTMGAGGDAGPHKERVHDGAPPSDAGAHRTPAGPKRMGSPSERDQGRQPDRESGDRDSCHADWNGDLPALSEGISRPLAGFVCPCGGTSLKYVADQWRPGIVLDPFAGSGTVASVASGLGRDSVSIDLNEANVELAQDRVGPLFPLDIVDHRVTP